MSDEALRALEKKIAGESERAKQSRDRDAKIEAHSAAAFHSGRAWAYEDVLELLRPLLATASEQAPVVLARGFFHRDETDEDGDYEIFGSKDDRCEKCIPCLIVTGSPAHTSEARDAEIEAVKSALDRAYWLGQEYWRLADSQSYSDNRRSDETRSRYNQLVIDTLAAMRQEGGNG